MAVFGAVGHTLCLAEERRPPWAELLEALREPRECVFCLGIELQDGPRRHTSGPKESFEHRLVQFSDAEPAVFATT